MRDAEFRRRGPGQREVEEELREIEVLIHSGEGLKKVRHVTRMRAFAEVYVERAVHVARTRVDETGGTDPVWNDVVRVRFPSRLPERSVMAALNVDVYAAAANRLGWDRVVGSARVLLCDVLKGGDAAEPVDNPIQCLTVQVWRDSGRPQGWLNLWVPPTGRFLVRRDSLSFSVRERVKPAAEESSESDASAAEE